MTLYRHAADAGEVQEGDPSVAAALEQRGGGQPLPAELRREMETELGLSLARVRVHTDSVAAQAALAVHADAFTVGEDIFFAEHAFAPETPAGRKLLAHELAHVAQALRGRAEAGRGGVRVSQPGEALEHEAEALAEPIERNLGRRDESQPQSSSVLDPFGMRALEAQLGGRMRRLLEADPASAPAHAERPAAVDAAAAAATAEASAPRLEAEPSAPRASRFDELRALGLRQILRAAVAGGGQRLLQATLRAADPAVVRAALPSVSVGPVLDEPGGRAMWRAAERYAATLYRRAVDSGEVASDGPEVEAALRRCGSGQPLPGSVRRAMEAALGVPLDRVRIHTDGVAAEAARAVHAEAFTVGEDIFFARGAFAPESRQGQRLLAHELTHVVQAWQGRTGSDGRVSKPGDALEREADAVADRVGHGPRAARVEPPAQATRVEPPAQATRVEPPAVTPKPVPVQAPGVQPLLRRPAAALPGAKPPRGKLPTLRGGARRATAKGARQEMQGATSDFTHRAGRATTQAADLLHRGLADAQAIPPGKRAKEQAQRDRRAAQAGEHEARATERQQQDKAKARASRTPETGGPPIEKQEAVDTRSAIELKPIADWSKYMPEPLPDQDERERKRLEELIRNKIEGDRKQAKQGLEKLRAAHLQQARDVRAMKPKLHAQIAASQRQSLAQVAAAESSQCAAVQGHVAGVQGQVRGHAAAMQGQLTAAHAAAIAKINATHRAAEQKLVQGKTKALGEVDGAETLALLTLALDFLGLRGRFTALGSRKAGDAIAVGEEERGKLSGRWDGDKLEAAQKAARDTADGFATAMAEQAAQKLAEIEANRPQAEQALRDFAKTTRDNINKAYDAAKQSLAAARQSSSQAADTAKQAASSQIDQACASTVASLGAHGASQVAAIRKQGQAARAGIVGAGQAARASVARTCDQSAAGIERGVVGLIRGARQIEAPNPEEAQQQVSQGVQALERGSGEVGKGLTDTAIRSSQGLTQQASGAVEGMVSTAMAATAAATQMGAGARQQMSTIAEGASSALGEVAGGHKTTTDGTVTTAQTGFTDQVKALGTSYEGAATSRATEFDNNYKQCESGLHQAVPDRGGGSGGAGSGKKEEGGGGSEGGAAKDEIASIQENAQKAADAVKPAWQRALAVVVSIVVAIAVVIVVTALVVTTGPVGMVLVGAAAGALSSVAGTMASNVVLGNGLFDGITWKTIAIGAIGGGLGAGLTAGLGAGASALAGSARFAGTAFGRGAQATSTALSGSASTLGQFAIKTGVGVGTDFVSEQTANLIVNQKLDISVESLVLSSSPTRGRAIPSSTRSRARCRRTSGRGRRSASTCRGCRSRSARRRRPVAARRSVAAARRPVAAARRPVAAARRSVAAARARRRHTADRDTDANQRGLLELQRLQNDPSLTPEQKAKLDHELAARMREQPDPPGDLSRDIQEARTRAQDPAGSRPAPEADGGGSPAKNPDDPGQGRADEGGDTGLPNDLDADPRARAIRGVDSRPPKDGGRGADGKPLMETDTTSLDGHSFHNDIRQMSPEARHVIRQLEKDGWVRVDQIHARDLVDISKWFGKEIGVVQSPVGQLRVILGTEDGVLKRQIAPGETFVVHTHPVTVTHKDHFGTDLQNAGKHIEAVIDWGGQITYFTKQDPVRGTGGLLNPTRPDGTVAPMHDYQAAFMDAVGNIVGFARIDVIEGPQGTRVTVRK